MPKRKKSEPKAIEIEYEINKYVIGLFSRPRSPDPQNIAIISLYENDDVRGYLNFFPNQARLPNPIYNKEKKVIHLYFHIDLFDVISDFLRNEQPLFITYKSPPPFGTLRSGKEPIGEEEPLFYPRD